jgi:hypothetical protein
MRTHLYPAWRAYRDMENRVSFCPVDRSAVQQLPSISQRGSQHLAVTRSISAFWS